MVVVITCDVVVGASVLVSLTSVDAVVLAAVSTQIYTYYLRPTLTTVNHYNKTMRICLLSRDMSINNLHTYNSVWFHPQIPSLAIWQVSYF